MTLRRLIRWKSFWLGILVLGFFVWAWAYSMTHFSGVAWKPNARVTMFSQASGTVGVSSLDVLPSSGFEKWMTWNEKGATSGASRFPPAIFLRDGDIGVAHWLLILLFLVPWVGFLVWRYGRQRKLTETNV